MSTQPDPKSAECALVSKLPGSRDDRRGPAPSPRAIFFLFAVWLECRTWQVTVTVYGRGRLGRKSERCRYPLGLNYARESLLTDCQTLGTPPGRNLRSLNRLETGKLAPSYRIKSTNMQPSRRSLNCLSTRGIFRGEKGKEKFLPADPWTVDLCKSLSF
jgi:hypothetical protein